MEHKRSKIQPFEFTETEPSLSCRDYPKPVLLFYREEIVFFLTSQRASSSSLLSSQSARLSHRNCGEMQAPDRHCHCWSGQVLLGLQRWAMVIMTAPQLTPPTVDAAGGAMPSGSHTRPSWEAHRTAAICKKKKKGGGQHLKTVKKTQVGLLRFRNNKRTFCLISLIWLWVGEIKDVSSTYS